MCAEWCVMSKAKEDDEREKEKDKEKAKSLFFTGRVQCRAVMVTRYCKLPQCCK